MESAARMSRPNWPSLSARMISSASAASTGTVPSTKAICASSRRPKASSSTVPTSRGSAASANSTQPPAVAAVARGALAL